MTAAVLVAAVLEQTADRYEVLTDRMAEVNPAVWDLLRVPR